MAILICCEEITKIYNKVNYSDIRKRLLPFIHCSYTAAFLEACVADMGSHCFSLGLKI